MIELLLASTIVGSTQIAPNLVQIDYLTPNQQIITLLDNIELSGGEIDYD